MEQQTKEFPQHLIDSFNKMLDCYGYEVTKKKPDFIWAYSSTGFCFLQLEDDIVYTVYPSQVDGSNHCMLEVSGKTMFNRKCSCRGDGIKYCENHYLNMKMII